MRIVRTLAPLTLAAALSALSAAHAGGLVDYDGDGLISRVEFHAAVTAIARAADADGDGVITGEEFAFTPADLALFDNDGDGRITAVGVQEFIDGMDLAFDAMDADMNDYLDSDELAAARGRYGIAAPAAIPGQAASAKPRPFNRG